MNCHGALARGYKGKLQIGFGRNIRVYRNKILKTFFYFQEISSRFKSHREG